MGKMGRFVLEPITASGIITKNASQKKIPEKPKRENRSFYYRGFGKKQISPPLRILLLVVRAVRLIQMAVQEGKGGENMGARQEQQKLAENRVQLRTTQSAGLSELHKALLEENGTLDLEALDSLITMKSANCSSSDGRTPMHLACSVIDDPVKRCIVIKKLLSKGASLYTANKEGMTPLSQLKNFEADYASSVLKIIKKYGYETEPLFKQREHDRIVSSFQASGGVGAMTLPSAVYPDIVYSLAGGVLSLQSITSNDSKVIYTSEWHNNPQHFQRIGCPNGAEFIFMDNGVVLEIGEDMTIISETHSPHLAYCPSVVNSTPTSVRNATFTERYDMKIQANLLAGSVNFDVLSSRNNHVSICLVTETTLGFEASQASDFPESTYFDETQGYTFTVYVFNCTALRLTTDAVLRHAAASPDWITDNALVYTHSLELLPSIVKAVHPHHVTCVVSPEDPDSSIVWSIHERKFTRIMDKRGRGVHSSCGLTCKLAPRIACAPHSYFLQISTGIEVHKLPAKRPDESQEFAGTLLACIETDDTSEERFSATFLHSGDFLVLRTSMTCRDLFLFSIETLKITFVCRFPYMTNLGEHQPKHKKKEKTMVAAVNTINMSSDDRYLIRHNSSLGTCFVYDYEEIARKYSTAMYLNAAYCEHPTGVSLEEDGSFPAPTGEVTIVFTDVQGSTSLWEHHEIAMSAALEMHNVLIRKLIRRWCGFEVKTEGDSFMVSFSSPLDALNWTLSVQQQLLTTTWPEAFNTIDNTASVPGLWSGFRVRMGFHQGRPSCARDPVTGRMDYFGPVVNLAARVAHVSHGGQILLSGPTFNEIMKHKGLVCCEIEAKQLGVFKLKGITGGIHLVQVLPKELASRVFGQSELESVPSPTARAHAGTEHHLIDEMKRMYPNPFAFAIHAKASGEINAAVERLGAACGVGVEDVTCKITEMAKKCAVLENYAVEQRRIIERLERKLDENTVKPSAEVERERKDEERKLVSELIRRKENEREDLRKRVQKVLPKHLPFPKSLARTEQLYNGGVSGSIPSSSNCISLPLI